MLSKEILSQFRVTMSVPIVSSDPVDRPLGRWLQGDATKPDTVLVGIPFDGATVVPSRKGAAGGPAAVRECLGDLNSRLQRRDKDLVGRVSSRHPLTTRP